MSEIKVETSEKVESTILIEELALALQSHHAGLVTTELNKAENFLTAANAMSKTKLTGKQERLLQEALRRYIQFYSGWELTEAWTGLGYRTTYKPVLDAGLMEWCATGGPKPRCMGWLRLTESGAKIVQAWLDEWTKEITK